LLFGLAHTGRTQAGAYAAILLHAPSQFNTGMLIPVVEKPPPRVRGGGLKRKLNEKAGQAEIAISI
jgi:hypothetical protein